MKADMCSARARVRCGPIANMESAARSTYGFLGMPPSANVRAVSGPSYGGRSMSDNPDHTRRWLINASGAAILSNVLTGGPSSAQVAGTSTTKSQDPDEASADAPISPVTTALCDYVASALDRDMPPEVVAKAKLHTLDTIAAMVSGSRLKAGEMAARYVDSLGGKPQATVIGTGILTSTVNAALANGMAAHGDETDDSHLRGRFHPGCGIVRRHWRQQNMRAVAATSCCARSRSATTSG